jgi:dipeptidyl aminopeptidase/acylaminoacyl peptidase
MGPHTLAAAGAALDKLKRTPGVDSLHLGAWGISRGATVAAALASRRSDLGCVIAQSGMYDLQATYRGTKASGLREAIVAEAGSDSAGWKERSPIVRVASTHTPILILHGENDTTAPAEQAHGYAATLKAGGVAVESSFFPTSGHELPAGLVTRPILIFLEATLHH